MRYKNVLVHLEDEDSDERVLQAAIVLAEQHEAHLSGIYVTPYPTMPLYVESRLPAKLITEMAKMEEKKLQTARDDFVKQCDASNIAHSWFEPQGDRAGELIARSRYADLVVIAQKGSIKDARASHEIESSIIMGAARPVLVVPYIGVSKNLGKRILVAWNDSREATRAVNDAMPILTNADFVDVMTITESEGRKFRPTEMAHYLARHGVSCEASNVARGELTPALHILNRATDRDMDTIVMGAYGHSRLRELILGGDSRTILQQMTVPILMSH